MLDATLKSQLTAYLQNLREPIALVATLGDGAGAGVADDDGDDLLEAALVAQMDSAQ